jgi:hypothetical protein
MEFYGELDIYAYNIFGELNSVSSSGGYRSRGPGSIPGATRFSEK